MKNYIHDGDRLTVVAPSAVTSGSVVRVNDLVGVALHDAVSGANVTLQLTGVARLRKAAGTFNPGVRVFWDATNARVTTTATGNRPIGFHAGRVANSGGDNTEIDVLLTPAPIATA